MANPYVAAHTGAEIDDAVNRGKGLTPGTALANKALVLGASKDVDTIDIAQDGLQIAGTPITANPAELNTLDGLTASTAELNILDGVTADTAELNKLDGMTASAAELSKADKSEADGIAEASKNVILDSNKDLLGKRYDINQSILGLIASGPFMRFEKGLSPRMDAGDVSNLDFAEGDFSVAMCLALDGTTDIEIGKGATGDPDAGFEFRFKNDNDIEVYLSDTVSRFVNTAASPLGQYVPGEVFIVVFVIDKDGNLSQYYNGVLQGTLDISAHEIKSLSNASNFYVDRQQAGGFSAYFMRFFNYAMTLVEVRALSSGIPVSYANAGASMTTLITNGSMEVDANWANVGTPTTNAIDAVTFHRGANSRKFVVDGTSEGIKGDVFTTTTGKKYSYILWVYPSGTVVNVGIYKGDNSGWLSNVQYTGLNSGAWNMIVVNVIETAGGANAYIAIHSGAASSGTWYVDDVWSGQVGCTVRYEADAIFFLQWRDTSGNENHSDVIGAVPQSLPPGHEARYIKKGITALTTLTNILPPYYSIYKAIIKETTGNSLYLSVMWPSGIDDPADEGFIMYCRLISANNYSYLSLISFEEPLYTSSKTFIVRSHALLNGDMEETGNWDNVGTPTVNERSNTQVHGGSYSRKFTVDAINEGVDSSANYASITGIEYTYKIWVYPDDDTAVTIRIRKGDNSGWLHDQSHAGLNQDAWNEITIVETETAGGTSVRIEVSSGATAAGTWYVDDITIDGWNSASVDLTLLMESVL